MKDIRQLKIIIKALDCRRERHLQQLARLNGIIESKKNLINKMKYYQHDYTNNNTLKMSKSVSGLNQNLDLFIRKMEEVITQTSMEISQLQQSVGHTYSLMTKVDQELELMHQFMTNLLKEKNRQSERNEQLAIDDLASVKKAKGIT